MTGHGPDPKFDIDVFLPSEIAKMSVFYTEPKVGGAQMTCFSGFWSGRHPDLADLGNLAESAPGQVPESSKSGPHFLDPKRPWKGSQYGAQGSWFTSQRRVKGGSARWPGADSGRKCLFGSPKCLRRLKKSLKSGFEVKKPLKSAYNGCFSYFSAKMPYMAPGQVPGHGSGWIWLDLARSG